MRRPTPIEQMNATWALLIVLVATLLAMHGAYLLAGLVLIVGACVTFYDRNGGPFDDDCHP